MPTWVYEVLVTKSDLHTAIEYVKRVERELDLLTPIEPKPTKKTGKQWKPVEYRLYVSHNFHSKFGTVDCKYLWQKLFPLQH